VPGFPLVRQLFKGAEQEKVRSPVTRPRLRDASLPPAHRHGIHAEVLGDFSELLAGSTADSSTLGWRRQRIGTQLGGEALHLFSAAQGRDSKRHGMRLPENTYN
jgi:hypothetical protein